MKKHTVYLCTLFIFFFNCIANPTQNRNLITHEEKNELKDYKTIEEYTIFASSLITIGSVGAYCLTYQNPQNLIDSIFTSNKEKTLALLTFLLSYSQSKFLIYKLDETIKNGHRYLNESNSNKLINISLSVVTFTFMTFFSVYSIHAFLTNQENSLPIITYSFFNFCISYKNYYINDKINDIIKK